MAALLFLVTAVLGNVIEAWADLGGMAAALNMTVPIYALLRKSLLRDRRRVPDRQSGRCSDHRVVRPQSHTKRHVGSLHGPSYPKARAAALSTCPRVEPIGTKG
jgi:hypothetical protein